MHDDRAIGFAFGIGVILGGLIGAYSGSSGTEQLAVKAGHATWADMPDGTAKFTWLPPCAGKEDK